MNSNNPTNLTNLNENEIQQLKDESDKAYREFTDFYEKWRVKKNEIEHEFNKHLNIAIDIEYATNYKDRYELLRKRKEELNKQLEDINNAKKIESAKNHLPYPEGTILTKLRHGWHGSDVTKIKGVVQVFKEGDVFSSHVRYNHPNVGDVVVREIKKDGTLSIKCEKYWETNWILQKETVSN